MLDYNNIYNTYTPKLRVMFNKQVKDKDYIDDLIQDTMLKVWENLGSYNDSYQLSTWIYTIGFNTLKNYFRSNKDIISYSPTVYDNEYTEDPSDPQDILSAAQIESQFNSAVKSMEENYLDVYILKEVDGLTYQAISTQLDIPMGTVKSRLSRAKDHIKKSIK